ncbi:hypothetical protein VCHENC02_0560B, partial [Vibrio harveyi]
GFIIYSATDQMFKANVRYRNFP